MDISDFRHRILQKNLTLELKNPYVVTVSDEQEGFSLTNELLYAICDKKTLLLLSGGRTPKQLYEMLGKEETLEVGAAGLIDERYGEPMHEDSNEWMIRKSGLLGYLEYKKIPFYLVLNPSSTFVIPASEPESQNTTRKILNQVQDDKLSIEDLTHAYDQTLRMALRNFSKNVGILGIGLDGHTAGIPIKHSETIEEKNMFFTSFSNFPGKLRQRISMTYLGLSMLDILLVLVFGEDKKEALEKVFEGDSEKEIPARFFKRAKIAPKTLIITDQKV